MNLLVRRVELDEGGDHHILIAGGIGITPILSMAARLDEFGFDFRLYYVTLSRAETNLVSCEKPKAELNADAQATV